MFKVGHKTEDIFGTFSEYSIKGIPKKSLKIVIQKGKDEGAPLYGVWYIYEVTKDIVKTIGWSRCQWKAEEKARKYIRNELTVIP
jgi:hypothetical protein